MEALNFMKFWRARTRRETKISDVLDDTETELEFSEGDDSFFELELSLSGFSLTYKKTPEESTKPDRTEATTMKTTSSVSSTDYFSKNKVIPVEIGTKLDSPIAHLKSGSKFRAFSFKKLKPVDSEKSTSGTSTPTLRNEKPLQDAAAPSVPSLSKKIFSLIKPLQAMTVKKQTMKEDGVSVMSSPVMEKQRSNVAVGIRIVRRHLGKSRSASAAVGGMSPVNRYDESLQVQQDGIQSAILHCKRSFDGSRESSLLSRSTSDSSSREKLSTSSSEESYTFSRIASDHISDKSMETESMNVALKSLCFGSGDLDQGTVAEQSIMNKKSLN